MAERTELEPGYVLHRRPYSNTSLIIEFFSRHHGRIGLMARGARRGRNPKSAVLQPFRPLLASWYGRGELATLGAVEAAGRSLGLQGETSLQGLYLNELMVRLTHRHDPNPALFDEYGATLQGLVESPGEATLRRFEVRLLDHLGYAPRLVEEADGVTPVHPDGCYCYHPETGPVAAVETASSVGPVVAGTTLLAMAAEEYGCPVVRREAKAVMRAVLALHLGDRPLASRALFRRRRNAPETGPTHPPSPPDDQ